MQTARRLLSIAAALVVAAAAPALAQLDPLGSEFQVNTFTPGIRATPTWPTDAQGNFVAVWDGPATNSLAATVFVQRFDRDGVALGTEYEVPTGMCAPPRFDPAMCRNSAGGGVLAWSMLGPGETAKQDRRPALRQHRQPVGNGVPGQQPGSGRSFETYPSVACGDAGDFVVVWNDYAYPLATAPGILGRRFDSAGAPEGTEFQVNTYTSGYFRQPKVATDGDRDFVVVWTAGPGIDGSGSGVFGQRFASNGDFLGTEFQVNSYTMHDQQFPSVAVRRRGRLRRRLERVRQVGRRHRRGLRAAFRQQRGLPRHRVPGQLVHDLHSERTVRRLGRRGRLRHRLDGVQPGRLRTRRLRAALRRRGISGRNGVPGQYVHHV